MSKKVRVKFLVAGKIENECPVCKQAQGSGRKLSKHLRRKHPEHRRGGARTTLGSTGSPWKGAP